MQINHTVQFQELLTVSISHGYYADGRCPDFRLQLSPESQVLAGQHGFIVKTSASQISLALDTRRDFQHACYRDPIPLEIVMTNQNPQFLHFTEMPYLANQEIVFEPNPGREWLHPEDQVTDAICRDSDETGIRGTIRIVLNADNDLFSLGQEQIQERLPFRYAIRFGERSAYWKYFVYGLARYPIQPRQLVLRGLEGERDFGPATPTQLPDGRAGYVFVSRTKLPLRQRPDRLLGLYLRKGEGREDQLIKNLPCPSPRALVPDLDSENFLLQEFVYI